MECSKEQWSICGQLLWKFSQATTNDHKLTGALV